MKTEQLMIRRVGDLTVRQNHKTKMFCITDLAKAFPNKKLQDWVKLEGTKDFMQTIMERENLPFGEIVQTFKGRTEKRGTWVHPLLMVDYAMWVSPEFKYVILKWVHDNLCEFRDDVGERFKEMNAAIHEVLLNSAKGFSYMYANESRMIASVVGVQLGKRNEHSEIELKKMDMAQKMNAHLLRKGITCQHERRQRIVDTVDVMQSLRK